MLAVPVISTARPLRCRIAVCVRHEIALTRWSLELRLYLKSAGNFKSVVHTPQTSGIPTTSQEMKRWRALLPDSFCVAIR